MSPRCEGSWTGRAAGHGAITSIPPEVRGRGGRTAALPPPRAVAMPSTSATPVGHASPVRVVRARRRSEQCRNYLHAQRPSLNAPFVTAPVRGGNEDAPPRSVVAASGERIIEQNDVTNQAKRPCHSATKSSHVVPQAGGHPCTAPLQVGPHTKRPPLRTRPTPRFSPRPRLPLGAPLTRTTPPTPPPAAPVPAPRTATGTRTRTRTRTRTEPPRTSFTGATHHTSPAAPHTSPAAYNRPRTQRGRTRAPRPGPAPPASRTPPTSDVGEPRPYRRARGVRAPRRVAAAGNNAGAAARGRPTARSDV